MIIHVEICDLCDAPNRGAPFEAYSLSAGPTLHICRSCQEKPFRGDTKPSAKGQAVLQTVRMMLGI